LAQAILRITIAQPEVVLARWLPNPIAMKLYSLLPCVALVQAAQVNPMQKIIQMLGDLEAKVIREGEDTQKTYAEFSEWCEDRSRNLKNEITTGKRTSEELTASINKAASQISSLTAGIEKTAGNLATSEADLKAARFIRETEAKDFAAVESEAMNVIDSLERAIRILEKEMNKGGAAMMQLKGATGVVEAMKVLVDASLLGSQDAERLTAFVQSAQKEDNNEFEQALGAPDPAVYESKSGSIVEVLQSMLEKAKDQLDDARKQETTNKHNFELLEQSLKDEMKFANSDMDKMNKEKAEQANLKATAEGDLTMTQKELAADEETRRTLRQNCMSRAEDFEAEVKSRGEELKALGTAKKIIRDQASGASGVTYGAESFLQVAASSRLRTSADMVSFEAVRVVRRLGEKDHSEALMQLARRMASNMRSGASAGGDQFGKVKGLIRDMLEKLQKEAEADASHKAYCDEQTAETNEKKADKEAESEKLQTSIDSMSAKSAQLKEEVAAHEKTLAELARSTAELSKIRQEEKAEFDKNSPEMENGLTAVKLAIKTLREYYASDDKAHDASTGAANGILGLLEVVESDFSKTLAEMTAAENAAEKAYDTEMKANEIERTTAEQAVKYKTKEANELDQSSAEAKSDLAGVTDELNAILTYKKKIDEKCVAKPETYEERKARREAELAGLKQALEILEGETALMQTSRKLTLFRGRESHLRGGSLSVDA